MILFASPAYADTYSWDDGQGVNFTDNLQKIPSKFMDKAYVIHDDGSKETLKSSNKRNRAAAIETEKRKKAELAQKKRSVDEYTGPLKLSVGMEERYMPQAAGVWDKVIASEGSYGILKQYVFTRIDGKGYVYTLNGRVTSWQSMD